MIVDLNREEIIKLIKGTPPNSYDTPLISMGLGEVTGFPNEKWVWNDSYFKDRQEQELWGVYLIVKQLNSK